MEIIQIVSDTLLQMVEPLIPFIGLLVIAGIACQYIFGRDMQPGRVLGSILKTGFGATKSVGRAMRRKK